MCSNVMYASHRLCKLSSVNAQRLAQRRRYSSAHTPLYVVQRSGHTNQTQNCRKPVHNVICWQTKTLLHAATMWEQCIQPPLYFAHYRSFCARLFEGPVIKIYIDHVILCLQVSISYHVSPVCVLHSIPCYDVSSVYVLQKVCITVPGVRPLADEELDRRFRAVEHVRSGIRKLSVCCHLSHSFAEAQPDLR